MDKLIQSLMSQYGLSREQAEKTAKLWNVANDEDASAMLSTPAPTRYSAGSGKSAYSNSPTVRTLVNKYETSPEGAVALAARGAGEDVQRDAMGDVAARETRRLKLMKRYQDIKAAQESGAKVSLVDSQWADSIDQRVQSMRKAEVQQSANDALAAKETQEANDSPRVKMQAKPSAPQDMPLSQQAMAMRSFRPGTGSYIGPDQKSLVIPVGPSKTATALMTTFGMDQASAMQLAAQLEGAQ